MNKREFDLLKQALDQEEIDIPKVRILIGIMAKQGEISELLKGVSTAVLASDPDRIELECHKIRASAMWITWKYVEDSRLFLEYTRKSDE